MQTGQEVYNEMNQRIEGARQSAATDAAALQALTEELAQARSREAAQTGALARLRLDLLAANQITSGLDAADQRALVLLAERDRRSQALQGEIDTSVATQMRLTEARTRALAEHDARHAALDELVQSTRDALDATVGGKAASDAADAAAARATSADEKADQAELDRSQKRVPYESDRLFMYLWQRRYGFAEYAAMPLIRALDGWVARLIGYEAAHRNYPMLLALADRMRENAVRQQDDADTLAELFAEIDQQALEAAGVPTQAQALNHAADELAAAEQRLESEEARHQQLLAERASIAAGSDVSTVAAIKAIHDQLESEDMTTLRADAQITASASDDALVAELANLRAQASALAARVAPLQTSHEQTLKRLAEIEELRVRFRNSTYDSNNSRFGDGLGMAALLDGLFRGALVLDEVWKTVAGKHSVYLPRSSSSTSSSGGWSGSSRSSSSRSSSPSRSSSSSSSRSSGGFRSGGSFGGGGFRTGGGF